MSTSTEPAIKSYFFGKGYRDLIAVIKESWESNLESTKDFFSRIKRFGEWWEKALSFIFWGGAGVSVIVFGTLFFVTVSLLHILLLGSFFLLIYIGFTIVWVIERTYLFFQGFFSVCPHCHEKTVLPEYLCDKCGKIHKKLVPNTYGILFHQCQCGQKLPATFFVNRGRLQARCSHDNCHQLLHREHVESKKIFVPILGGPSAGKTAFMFAVVRQLVEEKAAEMGFEAGFVDSNTESEYKTIVDQLRKGNVPTKTVASIPKAFNLALKKNGKTKWFLYIYDPAGEAFENTENLTAHQYYDYVSGMIMIVDPFSIPAVRRDYENKLSRTWSDVNPSQLNIGDALARVLLTLEESFGLSKTDKIKKSLAVVISKVDAFGLDEIIGEVAVDKAGGSDRTQIKNDLIRQQLIDWDEGGLIQQIETRFKSVRYFSGSALGRIPDSTSKDFVPQHVFEPMSWLLNSVIFKKSKLNLPALGMVTGIVAVLIVVMFWSSIDDNTLPDDGTPEEPQSISENSPEVQTPEDVVRAYYEAINRGNTELAIRKWLDPNEDNLRGLIEGSEWVRLNEVHLINQNAVNATLSLDVTGKAKSYTTAQRWKGTIELENNVDGEWKIVTMRLRDPTIIYQENDTFHLGDEKIRGWQSLHGDCFTATFYVDSFFIQTVTLKLDIWNSDSSSNAILLNGMKVASLPYQDRRIKKWVKEQVVLPTYALQQDSDNQLQICSGVTAEGDKDDLRIRKIRLRAE